MGCKRPALENGYFETFNRPNVDLVDISANPIRSISPSAIHLQDQEYPLEAIVMATGFDAMTGSLLKLGIKGRNNLTLAEAWKNGPQTFLGLSTNGFPNLFMITGPGSPSVLTNMPRAIEQHTEWITRCVKHCDDVGATTIEAENAAMLNWTDHVTAVANQTLLPKANHSWYFGGNIPGKPRNFMPYSAGLDKFRSHCQKVATSGYLGFKII
jgi:cation diffusion facilitator CzcD-associated flavoprotein CzcO